MMIRLHAIRLATLSLIMVPPLLGQPQSTAERELDFNGDLIALIEARQFAGVAAGIGHHGDVRWSGSAGLCDVKADVACTEETIFRIASIAKPMTAVAVLQLYERGLLDLDAAIAKYLPDYPSGHAQAITVRHLLHHTAGIGGYRSAKESETTKEYDTLRDAARVFQDRELAFDPGTAYQYTTYGYVVLGLVIESASGMTYGDYMQKAIWDRAGMSNTGVERFGETRPNQSKLYSRSKKGRVKAAASNNLSNRIPGGGVYSTVGDLLRFGQAVLDGSLLNSESLELMQRAPDVDRGQNNPYGMGWFIYESNPETGRLIGHSGEQAGAAGQLLLLPREGLVVAVLSNTSHAWQQAVELAVTMVRRAMAP